MEFTAEQQAEIEKLKKEALIAKETELNKKMQEAATTKDTELSDLKAKNEELTKSNDSLNNKIINEMFKNEGIELNEIQSKFIKQNVEKYDANNLDEIKSKTFELLGKKVDIKQTKTKNKLEKKEDTSVDDLLGLLG